MENAKQLWTTLYNLADVVLSGLSEFALDVINALTTEVVLGFSVLEVMLGVGISVYITRAVIKWVNPLE